MQLSKYFNSKEFDSPDVKGSGQLMNPLFIAKLTTAREIAGIPFIINSGYRTVPHNKKVGGVANSSHLKGLAADIRCNNDNQRIIIVNALLEAGFTRIGIAKSFIHVDDHKEKNPFRLWLY